MSNFENIIKSIRDILKNEGITGMDSISHCIAFIIMKYLNASKCNKFNIPIKYAFENFLTDEMGNQYPNNDSRILTKFYSQNAEQDDLLTQLREKFNFTQLSFKMNSPFNFVAVFKKISEIDLDILHEEYDIVGLVYEIHLKTGTSNPRDLGQYFTHRKVIRFMIDLCEPKIKPDGQIETILDPSMGTGGFLTMSMKYLNKKYQNIDWNINKSNIYGFDIDENVKNLALLNSLMESGEILNTNLVKNDTLRLDYKLDNNTIINNVDIIFANEPFGIKGIKYKDCCKRIKELKIEGTKSEPLFLQLMFKSLNKNGRCAVIVPDGVLFNESNLHLNTRKYLIENLNLKKVISLGDKLFLNTGVQSSILFFINDGKTNEVEFSEIKLVDNQIKENSIIKICYNDIVAKKYYLMTNKYIERTIINFEKTINTKLCDIFDIFTSKLNSSDMDDNGVYNFYSGIADNPAGLHSQYNFDFPEYLAIIKGGGAGKCKYGDNIGLGKIHYLTNKNTISNGLYILRLKENILNVNIKYTYYIIKQNKNNIMDLATYTTNLGNIKIDSIKNFEIPIPSIESQKQIVDILDLYYNKIELNKKSIANYEQLKKIYIDINTKNCNTKILNDICEMKSGKFNSGDCLNDGSYPFYSSCACNPVGFLNDYCFDFEKYIILIKDGGAGQGNYGPQIGLGKVFLVSGKSSATSHQLAIYPKENCDYLYFYLQSIKNLIMDLAHYTTGLGTIKKSDIDDIKIPLPSIETQNDIIKQCEYYDQQINILNKENEMLTNNNVINIILKSIEQTNETIKIKETNESNSESLTESNNENKIVSTNESNDVQLNEIVKKKVVRTRKVVKK